MPLQNRVLPTGEIVAHPARGMFTGNRGILHDRDGKLGVSRWRHQHWLICDLKHPLGTYHGPMPERGWSALFFLDEAVSLAAGHRPCHYCRQDAARRFAQGFSAASGQPSDFKTMDRALHKSRVTRQRVQVRYKADAQQLPDGCFILWRDAPALVLEDHLLPFTPEGYGAALPRPEGQVTVLTPAPTVGALLCGFRPVLHPTATLP